MPGTNEDGALRAASLIVGLISFTAWSSPVHGLIMLVQALRDSAETANLFGDVPALILIGVVLIVLQRGARPGTASA